MHFYLMQFADISELSSDIWIFIFYTFYVIFVPYSSITISFMLINIFQVYPVNLSFLLLFFKSNFLWYIVRTSVNVTVHPPVQ
jgi:hypothetical protein